MKLSRKQLSQIKKQARSNMTKEQKLSKTEMRNRKKPNVTWNLNPGDLVTFSGSRVGYAEDKTVTGLVIGVHSNKAKKINDWNQNVTIACSAGHVSLHPKVLKVVQKAQE